MIINLFRYLDMSKQRGRRVSIPISLTEAENNEQVLRSLYGRITIGGFFHSYNHLRLSLELFMRTSKVCTCLLFFRLRDILR